LASVSLRDRLLLKLEMTETFRPSELFALRWNGFAIDRGTLTVTHTAYRGKLREFGKTQKALRTVHLPEGLVNELWLWKQECPDHSPEAFVFPNARKRNGAKKNSFIRTDNCRSRVLAKLAAELELPKLNFQVMRRTMATLAQTKGGVKDVQGVLGHSKADTTVNVYMQPIEARTGADSGVLGGLHAERREAQRKLAETLMPTTGNGLTFPNLPASLTETVGTA